MHTPITRSAQVNRRRTSGREAERIGRFIRKGLAARRFANTDALLIEVDAAFPDARFAEFVGGYFLATLAQEWMQ